MTFAKSLRRLATLAAMGRRERQSVETIHAYQDVKLRRIVRMASAFPYYNQVFREHQISPERFTRGDLQRLPVLTRDILRREFSQRNDERSGRKVSHQYTSGSAGAPLGIATATTEYQTLKTLSHYAHRKTGLKATDVLCYMLLEPEQLTTKTLTQRIGLWKTCTLDIRKSLVENVDRLIDLQPEVLCSFPSYLSVIAKYVRDHQITIPSLRLVLTGGEVLFDETRRLLENALASEVRDIYSSVESGRVAFECPYASMHVIPDSAIVEVVNSDRDGIGEILITSLFRENTPLIRYAIGDRGKLADAVCRCGVPFQTIEYIDGRCNDFVVLPSGRKISWRSIVRFRDVPGIVEYQIVQKTRSHFEVVIQKDDQFTDEGAELIRKSIRDGCYGEAVDVAIVFKDRLSRGRTGKLQAVISEVAAHNAGDCQHV